MNTAQLIAKHLLEVHEGNNWTEVDITGTLKDVTPEEAVTITPASPNTIATLLHHITFWNRVMVSRIKEGTEPVIPEHNGFGMAPLENEHDWQQLKEDNLASAHELADAMRSIPDDKLETPLVPGHSPAYRHLLGATEHIHYHLGQLVSIKKSLRTK